MELITVAEEACFVCGHTVSFQIARNARLFREATCSNCGASKRNSDVARSIVSLFAGEKGHSLVESIGSLKDLHIYEAAASGKIHALLSQLPHYVCSEFLENTPFGSLRKGIRNEDLTRLTFHDNSFDLVITQDVLEHISEPMRAFSEIKRVLKSGGYHIFTVPLHEGRATVSRAILEKDTVINLRPPVYHGDPLCKDGALVYTDFGDDLVAKLNSLGLKTEMVPYSTWYSPHDITFVDSADLYRIYLDAYKNKELFAFFAYNSLVFISQKAGLSFTGERYISGMGGILAYEHIHRYAVACDYVSGKTALDIACGEGYGTRLLAKNAKRVVGVDIAEEAITHARAKYRRHENIDFYVGSCTDIPTPAETFDVVVSFETIEHIYDQKGTIAELSRVLKPDGILIISSPNKYSNDANIENEYHTRELSLSEFTDLLLLQFKHVRIIGQRLTFSSHMWSLEDSTTDTAFNHYSGDDAEVSSSTTPPFDPLYFVAICTNADDPAIVPVQASLFTDNHDSLYTYYASRPPDQLAHVERQLRAVHDSWSWKITAPLRYLYGSLKLLFNRLNRNT